MKMATRRKTVARESGGEAEYFSLLREYASHGGEPALGQAYELGRRAMSEQRSLVAIASLHHQALQQRMSEEKDEKRRKDLLLAGAEFLGECLSPYEMAHRGFQDAIKTLRQLNETLEEQIKRVAYAVHDEAGQLLVAVHLALAEMARELPGPQQEKIARIEGLLNEVEKRLRRYSHELRPTILDDLGWIPAIRFLAEGVSKRAGLPINIQTKVSGRLPGAMETALYRIVQEALNNGVKHAGAKHIWIRMWREKQILCCSVLDDGVGFDAQNAQEATGRKGLGLIAMQERASAIGGTLRIESCPGRGTELSLRVPLEDSHAHSSDTRR
jgi:signal transduction histidine kinase